MEINGQSIKDLSGSNNKSIETALVNTITINEDEVILNVTLQPSGESPNVRMSFDYVGNGWGMYTLPEIGDEVLCVFPSGDLNRGICIKRLNNGVDRIPNGISQDNILLITKENISVNVIIKGTLNLKVTGHVEVEASTINIRTGG